jgi:hypothetical protein
MDDTRELGFNECRHSYPRYGERINDNLTTTETTTETTTTDHFLRFISYARRPILPIRAAAAGRMPALR